jgi:hypothetical protein
MTNHYTSFPIASLGFLHVRMRLSLVRIDLCRADRAGCVGVKGISRLRGLSSSYSDSLDWSSVDDLYEVAVADFPLL